MVWLEAAPASEVLRRPLSAPRTCTGFIRRAPLWRLCKLYVIVRNFSSSAHDGPLALKRNMSLWRQLSLAQQHYRGEGKSLLPGTVGSLCGFGGCGKSMVG